VRGPLQYVDFERRSRKQRNEERGEGTAESSRESVGGPPHEKSDWIGILASGATIHTEEVL